MRKAIHAFLPFPSSPLLALYSLFHLYNTPDGREVCIAVLLRRALSAAPFFSYDFFFLRTHPPRSCAALGERRVAALNDGCPFSRFLLFRCFGEQQRCCTVDIMTDGPYKAGAHCSETVS